MNPADYFSDVYPDFNSNCSSNSSSHPVLDSSSNSYLEPNDLDPYYPYYPDSYSDPYWDFYSNSSLNSSSHPVLNSSANLSSNSHLEPNDFDPCLEPNYLDPHLVPNYLDPYLEHNDLDPYYPCIKYKIPADPKLDGTDHFIVAEYVNWNLNHYGHWYHCNLSFTCENDKKAFYKTIKDCLPFRIHGESFYDFCKHSWFSFEIPKVNYI